MKNKLSAALRSKRGFTLVELIVVLVILAILAALLIPALTKYIDKANEKKIVAETRMVVMAAQTLTSEDYGANNTEVNGKVGDTGFTGTFTVAQVADLAEVDAGNITSITITKNKVSQVIFDNGATCTYDGTKYTVS